MLMGIRNRVEIIKLVVVVVVVVAEGFKLFRVIG